MQVCSTFAGGLRGVAAIARFFELELVRLRV